MKLLLIFLAAPVLAADPPPFPFPFPINTTNSPLTNHWLDLRSPIHTNYESILWMVPPAIADTKFHGASTNRNLTNMAAFNYAHRGVLAADLETGQPIFGQIAISFDMVSNKTCSVQCAPHPSWSWGERFSITAQSNGPVTLLKNVLEPTLDAVGWWRVLSD